MSKPKDQEKSEEGLSDSEPQAKSDEMMALNVKVAQAGDPHPALQLKDQWSIMLENGTLVAKD